MNNNRTYDLILYGATGFTGQLTAEYLARQQTERPFRWAIAGRNLAKLEEVRAHLATINPECATLPLLIADNSQPETVRQLTAQTATIISTIGPYALYGEVVVASAVETKTNYLDITGEPDFVNQMRHQYGKQATENRIRIIHCCGFDSIPHDLGALFAVSLLPDDQPIKLQGFVRAKGGFSGGTWQSAINGMSQRNKPTSPPSPSSNNTHVSKLKEKIHYNRLLARWAVPLPTIDAQIVRRSAKELTQYGSSFQYGHYLQLRSFPQVVGLITGVVGVGILAQFKFSREKLLQRIQSGDGPTEEERANGRFSVTFVAQLAEDEPKIIASVSGGDPGYTETAKMVSEAALLLHFAADQLPDRYGILTSAVGLGFPLINRLNEVGILFKAHPQST